MKAGKLENNFFQFSLFLENSVSSLSASENFIAKLFLQVLQKNL